MKPFRKIKASKVTFKTHQKHIELPKDNQKKTYPNLSANKSEEK